MGTPLGLKYILYSYMDPLGKSGRPSAPRAFCQGNFIEELEAVSAATYGFESTAV